MSSLVLLDSAVSIAEAAGAVILDSRVSIIDPGAVPIELDLTVLTDALLAGVAPVRGVCTELWIDLGAGLEQIPGSEIGADVMASESHDNVVDQLTFSLVGAKYDPLLRGALRGKQQVQLFVSYGTPGFDYRAEVFNGFLLSVSFDAQPPVAHCVALDSGCLYSEQLVTVDIKPDSGRSRLSVVLEKAAALDPPCPIGTIDLGSADGGTLHKAVSMADVRFADFVRDFLSPCGIVAWFSGGRLNLTRIKREAPFVVVGRENVASLSIVTPQTQVANVVLGVSVQSSTDALGYRPAHRTETVTAPYAPMTSTGFDALTDRIISRIDTTDTYYGDTIIRTEVDEYAWYAPQMARLVLHADDSITPLVGTPPFLFPDGTYRSVAAETLMLIRKTVTTRETGVRIGGAGDDPNVRFGSGALPLIITKETVDRYFWHFVGQSTYQVAGGVDSNHAFDVYLTESGEGLVYPTEQMGLPGDLGGSGIAGPDSQTVTEWAVTGEDGQIDYVKQTDLTYSNGVDRPKTVDGTFVYGTGTRTYKSLEQETRGAGRTVKTTRYAAVSEDKYTISETVAATGTLGPVRTDSSGSGARPFASKINPTSSTQELHSTITDTLRLALSGRLEEPLHNERCENAEELHTVAMARARDLAAIDVQLEMPLEGRMHKGRWTALDLPERGLTSDLALYVWSVDRAISGYRQTVGLKLYPAGMLP